MFWVPFHCRQTIKVLKVLGQVCTWKMYSTIYKQMHVFVFFFPLNDCAGRPGLTASYLCVYIKKKEPCSNITLFCSLCRNSYVYKDMTTPFRHHYAQTGWGKLLLWWCQKLEPQLTPPCKDPPCTKGTAPACPIFSFGFGVRMEPESHAPALKTGDAYRKSPSTDWPPPTGTCRLENMFNQASVDIPHNTECLQEGSWVPTALECWNPALTARAGCCPDCIVIKLHCRTDIFLLNSETAIYCCYLPITI